MQRPPARTTRRHGRSSCGHAFRCVAGMVRHMVGLSICALGTLGALGGPVPSAHLSSAIVGDIGEYLVVPGDTLRSLSARFGVGEPVIVSDNALTAGRPLVPEQRLRIDRRHIVPSAADTEALVVNIPQRHLFHTAKNTVTAYPVAVGGADWRTPIGAFKIVEKEEHPTWDVPRSIQEEMRRTGQPVKSTVPPGSDNPLGEFFIRLSFSAVGLHGTTAPTSIYRFATHGCIRLHPDDIADVFARVQVGDEGRIVYEPILLAQTEAGVFLEAHPDIYRRGPARPLEFVQQLAETRGLSAAIDWKTVREVLRHRAGIARMVSLAGSCPSTLSTSGRPNGRRQVRELRGSLSARFLKQGSV